MHSLLITVSVCVASLANVLGYSPSNSVTAILLALSVAMIGLPHGALDQKVGRRLFGTLTASASLTGFLLLYLGLAAFVILGWFLFPLVTILGFFCLSAWHFGLEEDERQGRSILQWLALVARGGMIIWVPVVFQPSQITALLSLILPTGNTFVAERVVELISGLAPLLAVLTIFDAITFRNPAQSDVWKLRPFWVHRLRLLAFAILFATANPLVSFGVYFCGWHSVRGLAHLREQSGLAPQEFLLQLLPISIVAIVLFGIGFLFSRSANFVAPALIQTVFIGLSAVAIPHLLLHIVSDSIRSNHAQGGTA